GKLEEGAFYVFTAEELQKELKDDFQIFQEYYNVNEFGAWENNYVLIRRKSDPEIETEFGITSKAFQQKKKNWKNKLLAFRDKRERPRLDDKTLTSWNALMLK